ncbi:MAG: hypothetical protein M5U22_15945 [Thermoleophilia bacterium]|nr:hypothetical protein [Thermoleophilia bacterium]
MGRSKGYSLVPKSVPSRQRTSFYKQIVADFLASGEESVLVEGTDRKPVTLVQGLRKVLEAEDSSEVRVIQRGQETYLTRE